MLGSTQLMTRVTPETVLFTPESCQAARVLRDYCEGKFPIIGDPSTGRFSVTGETHIELSDNDYPDPDAACAGAQSAFDKFTENKTGTLYWRIVPEIVLVTRQKHYAYYLRFLISNKSRKAEINGPLMLGSTLMDSPSGPDNTTKVYGSGWVATILTNTPIDGWNQVYCTSIGESKEQALEACDWVLNSFAAGREAFIRVKPESSSELDFDTKINHHRGIVRFSFRLVAGAWVYPEPNQNIPFGRIS